MPRGAAAGVDGDAGEATRETKRHLAIGRRRAGAALRDSFERHGRPYRGLELSRQEVPALIEALIGARRSMRRWRGGTGDAALHGSFMARLGPPGCSRCGHAGRAGDRHGDAGRCAA